jgi:DDE superfamily endonuclease
MARFGKCGARRGHKRIITWSIVGGRLLEISASGALGESSVSISFARRWPKSSSERVFKHVQVLVAGAILTPGKRTVSSALGAMGLDQHKTFHRYHRVLSRAKWSTMEASRILLDSLVEAFVPEGPLVVGVDETLERRQGRRIAAKGI